MLDLYLRKIEKDGMFLAGYHRSQASKAEKTYLSEHLRIVRILSGAGRWRIRDSVYEVRRGDLLLFNNVTPRQIIAVTEGPLVYELIGFSTQVFSMDTSYIKLFYSNTYSPVLSAGTEEVGEISGIFELLKRKLRQEEPSSPVIVSLINAVCTMIFEACRCEDVEEKEPLLPSKATCGIMEKAIRYIEQNLCELHDVSEIARELHVSRGHFHKLFTKYTGYTPKHFINQCRIVRFVHFMTAYDMTVLDAAMRSGFESASGFYKTFQSICGMSPTEYLSQQGET